MVVIVAISIINSIFIGVNLSNGRSRFPNKIREVVPISFTTIDFVIVIIMIVIVSFEIDLASVR